MAAGRSAEFDHGYVRRTHSVRLRGGEGCAPYCYLGPIDLANWFNPELVDKLNRGDWDAHVLNVFSVDYIDCCSVADAIIRQNNRSGLTIR